MIGTTPAKERHEIVTISTRHDRTKPGHPRFSSENRPVVSRDRRPPGKVTRRFTGLRSTAGAARCRGSRQARRRSRGRSRSRRLKPRAVKDCRTAECAKLAQSGFAADSNLGGGAPTCRQAVAGRGRPLPDGDRRRQEGRAVAVVHPATAPALARFAISSGCLLARLGHHDARQHRDGNRRRLSPPQPEARPALPRRPRQPPQPPPPARHNRLDTMTRRLMWPALQAKPRPSRIVVAA